MKLTNRKIVNDATFLNNLANKQLPIRVSYAIAKNVSKIESELKVFNDERQKLLDKYCVKDEEGKNKIDENNQLKIADEHLESWSKDLEELLDIEIEIDIHKFNINELLNSDCKLPPVDLMLIEYMIEE